MAHIKLKYVNAFANRGRQDKRMSDTTKAGPRELRYTHFGVKFSSEFRLPVLTAVNIDGQNSVRIKRAGDRWFFDGRIDRKFQHGQVAFKDKEIDPCVFTAPVFSDEDPVLEEENVRVPLEFWKVVVMIDRDQKKLHATAYLLSQGQLIRKLLEKRDRTEAVEGFVLGAYRTFQIALADLEEATSYDFGDLKDADPLARAPGSQEAATANVPRIVPLKTVGDLVL